MSDKSNIYYLPQAQGVLNRATLAQLEAAETEVTQQQILDGVMLRSTAHPEGIAAAPADIDPESLEDWWLETEPSTEMPLGYTVIGTIIIAIWFCVFFAALYYLLSGANLAMLAMTALSPNEVLTNTIILPFR